MPDNPKACSRCGSPLGRDVGRGVCAACLIEDVLPAAEGLAAAAMFPSPEDGAPLLQRLGDYELLEEIGRGGMGVIYKARQAGLDRVVAVKLLLAGEFADTRARARFAREARNAARLTHPGIVTIHAVGEHRGRPYFAMEYVPGPNLAQRCRDGLLPMNTAARYVKQLARAVHYAHQHGVIHRDLKPANILVTPEDEPKLTDFGLTKSLVDPSRTIESAGSPNFMAPEQADSTLGPTSTATDVFGLGAVLYFLLTGRPPTLGESLSEILRAVVACEPVAPRKLRPALPRDLETITLRCLEREPARRYASALEVAEELARWRNHEPIRARPVSRPELLAKWIRRNPLPAVLGTGLVGVVGLGIMAVAWQVRRAEIARLRAEFVEVEAPWRLIHAAAELRVAEVAVADVNRDGRADVLAALAEDGRVGVFLARATGEFAPAPGSPYTAPEVARRPDPDGALAVADFDGDGLLDVAVANETSHSLSLLRGDGAGGFVPCPEAIPVGRAPRQILVADFNGDRRPDLAVALIEDHAVSVWLGAGAMRFTAPEGSPFATPAGPWGLASADFNGDRRADLAVANSGAGVVSVFLNRGAGRFVPAPASPWPVGGPTRDSRGSSPFDLTTADVNRDGHADLISADTRSHTITVFLGDGTGGFTPHASSPVAVGGLFPRRVRAADFDQDGRLDLVTANESGNLSLLAGDGTGGFVPVLGSPLFEPGSVYSVAVADLTGDGAPDLVACGSTFGLTVTGHAALFRRTRWGSQPGRIE